MAHMFKLANQEAGMVEGVETPWVSKKKSPRPPNCTGGRVVFSSPVILSSDLSLHVGLKGVDCEVGGYKNLGEKCSNCLGSL